MAAKRRASAPAEQTDRRKCHGYGRLQEFNRGALQELTGQHNAGSNRTSTPPASPSHRGRPATAMLPATLSPHRENHGRGSFPVSDIICKTPSGSPASSQKQCRRNFEQEQHVDPAPSDAVARRCEAWAEQPKAI